MISMFLRLLLICLLPVFSCYAERSYVHIVGSSTVFPLVSLSSEEFGRKNRTRVPIVESTGTGNGFKLFCAGSSNATPDIVTASRQISSAESMECKRNNVSDILEIKIGYDGIIIASSKTSPKLDFNKMDLFLALSSHIARDGFSIEKNPNMLWSDFNNRFPNKKIEIYGPSRDTGTYDSIVNIIFHDLCTSIKAFKIKFKKLKDLEKACSIIRDDGVYIEMGNEENLIAQKITSNSNVFGIFGYNFLKKNEASIQGNSINGIDPTYENIANRKYILSRPLYLYVKTQHLPEIKDLDKFIREITNDIAIGKDGYLISQGLIPLSEVDLKDLQTKIKQRLE